MISLILDHLMADDATDGEKIVLILSEWTAGTWVYFSILDFRDGNPITGTIFAALAIIFAVFGVKWRYVKTIVGPRLASFIEGIASNRLSRGIVYSVIAVALLLSIGFQVYRHYYPSLTTDTSTTDTSGPIQPPMPLESLTVSPIKLVFKDQATGTTSSPQIVTIINRASAPRFIKEMKITGNFSQTNDCPPELMIGDRCNVEVEFTPATPGLTYGDLEISSNDPLFSSVNLFAKVDFSGSGTTLHALPSPPKDKPLPDCTVDLAFYTNYDNSPRPPLSEIQAATDKLVDGYRRRTGECPKNNWLNEQIRKQQYPVWANVNCEAHGTGIRVNGQDTHFNQDVDIENLPCDTGVDVVKDAKGTTFGGKIKIRVAKPGQGDSVFVKGPVR